MEKVKSLILGSAKAIASFVVTYAVAQAIKKGITVDAATQAEISSALEALIVGVMVWLVPNKK